MFGAGAHGTMRTLLDKATRLCRDRRGVAAIEFAFIAPVLLILYFLTMEASHAIETSKKVSRISSMVGDLIAQQTRVNPTTIEDILKIASSTLQPYNRSKPTINITAIQISNDSKTDAVVSWSYQALPGGSYGAGPEKKGDKTTVPAALKTKGSFLIRVSSSLEYKPVVAWGGREHEAGLTSVFSRGITMGETYYLKPRVTLTVECPDCS